MCKGFLGNDYRYGFNGQEKDNELKGVGNSLDFGARVYDSRLGRWLSLDPLQKKYPSLNPYNFVANCPIKLVDKDGRKIYVSGEVDQKLFLNDLLSVFGQKALDDFKFDGNTLLFSGNIESYPNAEKDIATAVVNLTDSKEIIVNVFYETRIPDEIPIKTPYDTPQDCRDLDDCFGGEATVTFINSDFTVKFVFVNPAEIAKIWGEDQIVPSYINNQGKEILNKNDKNIAKDDEGQPALSGKTYTKSAKTESPRYARTFHGLGHAMDKNSTNPSKAIEIENMARKNHKSITIENGKVANSKPSPDKAVKRNSQH
jgi:RHS repeat-associated protein